MIREWQLVLGRHAKVLETSPNANTTDEGPSFADVM
jgi:hypothetical protein